MLRCSAEVEEVGVVGYSWIRDSLSRRSCMRGIQEWVGAWREWAMELVSLGASEVAPFCGRNSIKGNYGYARERSCN